MSKITLAPNISGSGAFTIAAPNSNSDRTLTLPDNSGTVQTELTNGFGFRNRIINGDMRIDQRNAGASGTGTVYMVDRWFYNANVASKGTWQQNAGGVTPPASFTNYLGFTSSSAYALSSTEFFAFTQGIEGFNTADLGWGTANAQAVAVSFWVRSSLTGTFGGAVRNSATNRSYPFSYTISAANTWEYKTVTIPGDTTGTWLTNNAAGLLLSFGFGAGSTVSGTAGAWAGSNLISATGATSVVGTNGATFYITGVQLEAGSVATPFERRPYGTELALCQRYYQLSKASAGYFNAISIGSYSYAMLSIPFAVSMRTAPTMATLSFDAAGTGAYVGSLSSTAYNFDIQYRNASSTQIYGVSTHSASAEL